MSWGQLLFSFRGRINRARYWLFVAVVFVAVIVLDILMIAVGAALPPVAQMPISVFAFIVFLALLYAVLAAAAKRLHDRNKSGWWLLVFYLLPAVLGGIAAVPDLEGAAVPVLEGLRLIIGFALIAIGIWSFVEIGCMGGTIGPNDYGPDPLPETGRRTR